MTLRPRPTYANVMSTLAVVLALSTGTAYAAGLGQNAVKSRNIADNAVKERHVANGAVQGDDLATGSVGGRALGDGSVATDDLADGSVTADDLGAGSVGKSEVKSDTVDSSRIQDGQVKGPDIASGSVDNTRLTSGVRRLMYDAGALAVNKTFGDFSVSKGTWPEAAPGAGANLTATWTQPGSSLDVVSGIARVEYPAACTSSSAGGRGLDVKITDGSDRVISASSPEYTDGAGYNGNGFWDQQEALPGVSFRPPNSSDLANDPQAFVDYIHLPFEMAELVASSSTSRTVKVFFKRSSSACTPVVTDARILVYRFAAG